MERLHCDSRNILKVISLEHPGYKYVNLSSIISTTVARLDSKAGGQEPQKHPKTSKVTIISDSDSMSKLRTFFI